MFGSGRNFEDAATNAIRNLQQKNRNSGDKSERKAAQAYHKKDYQYVILASTLSLLLFGILFHWIGILGWAFIPFFAIPFLISIGLMIKGRKNIDANREEQMKMHMMMKGDRRYWGRGEVDE